VTFDERLELLRQRHRLLASGVVVPKAKRRRFRPATPGALERRKQRLAQHPRGKSHGRIWQLQMQAQNRCQRCGASPLVTKSFCEPCRILNNERQVKRRCKKGATPKAVPNRCTVCGEPGHNAKHYKHTRPELAAQGAPR
jgi:hypothetical protein